MKLSHWMLSLMVGGSSTLVFAADLTVLDTYKTNAETLAAQSVDGTAVDTVRTETNDLITLGAQIMDIYAAVNPSCAAQFESIKADLPNIPSLPLDQIQTKYHDGQGLPTAPKHCYLARSLVVHPLMNIVRMNQGWANASVREEAADEFQEVADHIARVRKNIDTPPN